nr:acyltransferase family protein [Lysinibacillus timonensis]
MTDLKSPKKKFRQEIEGVRVVASLLVAIYHIWLGRVSGGVDVFFIVSGFLITTSLLSRMERDGKIHLIENYLGLIKRLIPLAFIVLFVTTIVSIMIMPQVQWQQIISETIASAFYYQNWELAFNSVDYLEQNNEASPLQHFWALSIQGQFYLTWPFVIMLSFLLARKMFKLPPRKTVLTVLVIFFIVSISYSIYKTTVNQPWAYFDTFARVWEFSLGGILALLISYVSLKNTASTVLGWLGLAIICLTGVLLPVSSVFPGYAALLPTTGVILVLIAGENRTRFGVENILGSKPLLWIGSLSYGFYLWHWPLLIFYFAYFKKETVPFVDGLIILLCTFVLSFITTKILEAPVRKLNVKQSKLKIASTALAFMLPVIVANVWWSTQLPHSNEAKPTEYSIEDYPGAKAIYEGIVPPPDVEPIPSMLEIKDDLPLFYSEKGCVTRQGDKLAMCSYGETENPKYTLALVGGSHSGHWFPTLNEFAKELSIRIDVYNHDGCRFTNDDFGGVVNQACLDWNELLINELIENPPDLVFTTANVNKGDTVPSGYINQFKRLEGITKILAVRDNPRMAEDIPLCLERESDYMKCTVPRDEALSDIPPWENTEGIPSNVQFADLSDYFCDETTCHSIIGNVIVYRDAHHLTAAYAKTLAPVLKEHVVKALEDLDT